METFQTVATVLVPISIHLVIHTVVRVWRIVIGDLGNIQTDLYGNAMYKMTDNVITLTPGDPCCIIGRMLIIHQDRDDCGMGLGDARAESLKTGNAGKRINCCYRVC